MKCDWHDCYQSGDRFLVKTTDPVLLAGVGKNEMFPIVQPGVERSYCRDHELSAREHGFRLKPTLAN